VSYNTKVEALHVCVLLVPVLGMSVFKGLVAMGAAAVVGFGWLRGLMLGFGIVGNDRFSPKLIHSLSHITNVQYMEIN